MGGKMAHLDTRAFGRLKSNTTPNDEATVESQDIKADDEIQETLALLKILALGNRQIEEGKVKPASDVIQQLKEAEKGG
jgi:hypothetical protein